MDMKEKTIFHNYLPKTYFTYPGYDVPFQRLRLILYRAVVKSKESRQREQGQLTGEQYKE